MNDKIHKIVTVYKRDGFIETTKKIYKHIKYTVFFKHNPLYLIDFVFKKNKYKNDLNNIFNKKYDRIIIWRGSFGWNVPLFQRPQHIARELSKQNCLVLYATYKDDKILTYKYVYDNLFLINFENKQFNKLLNKFISNSSIPKYIQLYSTDWFKSVLDIKKFISSGYKILYEYIDDLHPALTGTKDLAKNIVDKYKFCSENTNDVIVVTTADKLYNDVYMVRKDKNLIFSGNGVEYEHFIDIKNENDINKKMIDIIKLKKPIIGYYGALAKWFDYDLIKYIAFKKPEYEIVLIGLKYDTSFDLSKIEKISNVHYLGVIDYIDLPKYIKKMDIMTIPFLINDITKATSPCKLFEYMSASKPIVTTDLNECRKYKSVMIGKTKEEFVLLLDKAFDIIKKNDKKYFTLLKNEALANTWKAKAELIIKGLEKSEKTR